MKFPTVIEKILSDLGAFKAFSHQDTTGLMTSAPWTNEGGPYATWSMTQTLYKEGNSKAPRLLKMTHRVETSR